MDRLPVRRDTGRNPLFDVMLNLLNMEEYKSDILVGAKEENSGGIKTAAKAGVNEAKGSYEHKKSTTKFDLNWRVVDLDD